MKTNDNRTLIESAISKGWIRLRGAFQLPALQRKKYDKVEASRQMRAKRYAKGLTWDGKLRKTKQHPELKGFIGPEYHRRYMALWRGKPIQ